MTTNDKAVISAIDDEHETRWYVVNTYACLLYTSHVSRR